MAQKKYQGVKDSGNFSELNTFLSQFDKGGGMLSDYSEIQPAAWIHSGSYMLNALISGSMLRGWPSNKISIIAGDPKTGKSYFTFAAMRELQAAGYFIYFFETENSPDQERLESQGINMNQCRIVQPETTGEVIVACTQLTHKMAEMKEERVKAVRKWELGGKKGPEPQELPKIAIALDSITGLVSQKQLDDALAGSLKSDMGGVAKENKLLFNMMSTRCGKLGIPMICTAHVYEAQGDNMVGTPEAAKNKRISGGMGAVYLASVIVKVRKKIVRNEDDKSEKVGIIITCSIDESRYSRPRTVRLYIDYKKGLNKFVGVDEFISWEGCGLAKGKWVDLVDVAYELLSRKKEGLTVETLRQAVKDKLVIPREHFANGLSKPKLEALDHSLDWMVRHGYLAHEGIGDFYFTDKILEGIDPASGKYHALEEKVPQLNPLSPNYIARHLPGELISPNKIFNDRVMPREMIEELDRNVVGPLFQFGGGEEEAEAEDEPQVDEPSGIDALFAAVGK